MLRSKIINLTNQPVSVDDFKTFIGGISHDLRDKDIAMFIDNAIIWATEFTNIPACDFDVILTDNDENAEFTLLYDNIVITKVLDQNTGNELSYTSTHDNSRINLYAEYPVIIEYSCTRETNAVLRTAILNYAVVLYSGQTDEDAIKKIKNDLSIICDNIN